MPLTGLYFLPTTSADTSSFQTLHSRLTTLYNTTQLPRWTLEHRLFRETTSPAPTQAQSSSLSEGTRKPPSTRYLQVLNLSHRPGRSYVAITTIISTSSQQPRVGTPASFSASAEEPATLISIRQTEEFMQLLLSKFGPLWTQRQALSVANGLGFDIGDYRIRIGEARQGFGGAQMVAGVVVEVEWRGLGEGEDGAWEEAELMIRRFWESLAVAPRARECLMVAGVERGEGTIRQWCEILRLRA